jgi:hypothetical protein
VVDDWGPDPLNVPWRSTPLAADPLTSRSASDRMLAPPPEPGRTSSWTHRWADPATGSMPLDPVFLDQASGRPSSDRSARKNGTDPHGAPETDRLPADGVPTDGVPTDDKRGAAQRARRRPAVIDLGGAEGSSRTPFG